MNVIDYIGKRIEDLNQKDADVCKVRWDMTVPLMERAMARDISNELVARKHELEDLLIKFPSVDTNIELYREPIKKS